MALRPEILSGAINQLAQPRTTGIAALSQGLIQGMELKRKRDAAVAAQKSQAIQDEFNTLRTQQLRTGIEREQSILSARQDLTSADQNVRMSAMATLDRLYSPEERAALEEAFMPELAAAVRAMEGVTDPAQRYKILQENVTSPYWKARMEAANADLSGIDDNDLKGLKQRAGIESEYTPINAGDGRIGVMDDSTGKIDWTQSPPQAPDYDVKKVGTKLLLVDNNNPTAEPVPIYEGDDPLTADQKDYERAREIIQGQIDAGELGKEALDAFDRKWAIAQAGPAGRTTRVFGPDNQLILEETTAGSELGVPLTTGTQTRAQTRLRDNVMRYREMSRIRQDGDYAIQTLTNYLSRGFAFARNEMSKIGLGEGDQRLFDGWNQIQRLYAEAMFSDGGKALTATERSVLGPTLPDLGEDFFSYFDSEAQARSALNQVQRRIEDALVLDYMLSTGESETAEMIAEGILPSNATLSREKEIMVLVHDTAVSNPDTPLSELRRRAQRAAAVAKNADEVAKIMAGEM